MPSNELIDFIQYFPQLSVELNHICLYEKDLDGKIHIFIDNNWIETILNKTVEVLIFLTLTRNVLENQFDGEESWNNF